EHDLSLTRQAVKRLQTSLDQDPNNHRTLYDLACVYAVLNQPDDALHHLRLCLAKDPQHRYAKAAADDADLASLRDRTDFQTLLKEEAAKPTAEKFWQAGRAFQQVAEESKEDVDAVSNYRKAIEQYEQAVQSMPDSSRARFYWANCLIGLARHTSEAAQRRTLLES